MIKKFKTNITEVKRRSLANVRNLAIESLFITVTLIVVALLLFSNVIRVITTGKGNYDTFVEERNSLAEIKGKYDALNDEYLYVSSDEFKKLILRDTLAVAEEAERLYKTKESIEYYDEEVELFDLRDIDNYAAWWETLIKI